MRGGRSLGGVLLAFLAACGTNYAYGAELRPLEVRLVQSNSTRRFVARSEWQYLVSLTDCPGQVASVSGPAATHPVIRVVHTDVHVTLKGETRVIKFSLPQGATHPDPAPSWQVKKVVCGSRGYAVLYADYPLTRGQFVVSRFDHQWNRVGADIFSLPGIVHLAYQRDPYRVVAGRFTESTEGFHLVMVEVAWNSDQQLNAAERVALVQHEFLVFGRADTLQGYADLPGPLLTPAFQRSGPIPLMSGVSVPNDIQRHEVDIGHWKGAASVRVEVVDHPVYLRLRARHPVNWSITVASGARLAVIHLSGPPPQTISGISNEVVVLRFARQGGSQQEDTARSILDAHTRLAASDQRVPHYKAQEIILVDGKIGTKAGETSSNPQPGFRPEHSEDLQALAAKCATLANQDQRIECYRLRAKVLQGKRP